MNFSAGSPGRLQAAALPTQPIFSRNMNRISFTNWPTAIPRKKSPQNLAIPRSWPGSSKRPLHARQLQKGVHRRGALPDRPARRAVFLMLAAFGLVLAAAVLAFAALGICLLAGQSPYGLIPAMPRASALLFGLTLLPLSVLTAAGCAWYAAFLRQAAHAFGRFQQNMLAGASGRAALPALPLRPQFAARGARALRKTACAALLLFAVLFVAALAVSMLRAGAFEFWHVWGWFGYMGA